jgi:glycosyltransferase involved in cell wall biosynthesis
MKIFYPYPEEFTFNKAREIQTIHTCHALARRGCEVTLGVAQRSGVTAEGILQYFRLAPLPNLKFVFLPRYLHFGRKFVISFQSLFLRYLYDHITRACRKGGIDVIYTRHLKVAEYCLRQKFPVPLIFEAHEVFSLGQVDSPSKFKRLYEQEKFVYSGVQGLVTISNHLKEYLGSHFPIKCPIVRASDGVDLELFGGMKSDEVDPNLIIYTGSLFGWKGVDTVIKAMRYLPGRQLWIVGGSPQEIQEKRALANRWKVSQRCTFQGYITRTELAKPLARAHIGVLPNHREEISERFTSPLKLFEYMAAGKVIVASDLPSIREILDESKAYLCPPASPKSLATAIQSVYEKPELAKARISEARMAAVNFSWDRRAETIHQFLEQITGKRPSETKSNAAAVTA